MESLPMLDESLWKEIPGHEGYEAHPEGLVRSFRKKSFNRTKKPKILKGFPNTFGYLNVRLGSGKPRKDLRIHRIIAELFLENPRGVKCVNHLNGVKSDNRAVNLEWVTHTENNIHAIEKLGKRRGEEHGASRLTESEVLDIWVMSRGFEACVENLSRTFGVTKRQIHHIVSGKKWSYLTKFRVDETESQRHFRLT